MTDPTATVTVTALEQQAQGFLVHVRDLRVTDATTFEQAAEMVKGIATYIKRVGEVLDPMVEAAYRSHKVAVKQRDGLLAPAMGAKRILGERMAAWEQEQARARREAGWSKP